MQQNRSHTIADFYPTAILAFVSVVLYGMSFLALGIEWKTTQVWFLLAGPTTAIVFALILPQNRTNTIADLYPTGLLALVSLVALGGRFVAQVADWESKYAWLLLAAPTTAVVFALIMVRNTPGRLIAMVNGAVFIAPLAFWTLISVVALNDGSTVAVHYALELFLGILWTCRFLWHALNRNREQQTSSHCANCGYDLRGISSKRCPECGTMSRPQHDPRS